jgi:hypothetical protein
MRTPDEFDQYYRATLVPLLQSLDGDRKRALAAYQGGMFSLLLFFPVIAVVVLLENPWVLLCFLLPVILSVSSFNKAAKLKAAYTIRFKQAIIESIVKFISGQLHYLPSASIEAHEYSEGDLFRERIDDFRGGDLVEGRLGATALRFSEVQHREKRESVNSKGQRTTKWVTVFRGIFFIADFNKNFSGRTYALPESGTDFFGIGQLLDRWFEGRGEPVKLEHPAFEKYFKVFGTNQVEARYLLTPSLMEKIVSLREKLNAKMALSFINTRIFIALPVSKNLFEPNFFRSGLRADYLHEYFYYLRLTAGIVEDLSLNTRLWSKQSPVAGQVNPTAGCAFRYLVHSKTSYH